jgi:hypothetical protein
MNGERVISSLDLPAEAMVEQRIAKKLLIENGTFTASDKRKINEGIEELVWIAALKPNTIGVPEYKDSEREILEIAVLRLGLRAEAKATRIFEIIHRAIPYPVFLVTDYGSKTSISLATKRWAQNEGGKTVLDNEPLCIEIGDDSRSESLLTVLSLRKQQRQNLNAFYIGWRNLFEAYLASAYSGVFKTSLSLEEADRRRKALEFAESIQHELVMLKAQAEQETQMNRRVKLNLDIKRLEKQLFNATIEMA